MSRNDTAQGINRLLAAVDANDNAGALTELRGLCEAPGSPVDLIIDLARFANLLGRASHGDTWPAVLTMSHLELEVDDQ